MNDLSEKRKLNTRNRVETGMSKKKGTNEANIRPYGPGVTRFAVGSANSGHKSIKFLINMYVSFATKKRRQDIQYHSTFLQIGVQNVKNYS